MDIQGEVATMAKRFAAAAALFVFIAFIAGAFLGKFVL